VEDSSRVDPKWFEGADTPGIPAGASMPGKQVQEFIEKLRKYAGLEIPAMEVVVENVRFGLPASLQEVTESEQENGSGPGFMIPGFSDDFQHPVSAEASAHAWAGAGRTASISGFSEVRATQPGRTCTDYDHSAQAFSPVEYR